MSSAGHGPTFFLEGRIRDEDFAATLSPAGGSTDGSLQWVPDVKQAASGADPLLLLTDLQVFAQIDWPVVSANRGLGPGSSIPALMLMSSVLVQRGSTCSAFGISDRWTSIS